MLVDLTEVYGAGNEPTKDEFESMIRNQNNGNDFFTDILITNLIKGELLNPPSSESVKPPLYISFENELLNVITKYNDTKDLRVKMQKRGANNLFEFSGFYLINNLEQDTSPSPTSGAKLFEVGSDFFAPYQINAINNIDGDDLGGTDFTGGNHAYDGGSTGSPTARTVDLQVFVDGRKVTNFKGYASFVDIYWSNRIQASNTKKADGTGREVLQENIHLYYDGNKWHIDNTIEFLEKLKWQVHYGLQAQTLPWNSKIFYHNADNRKWNDASTSSNSISKDCNKVTLYKDDNRLDIELELDGLGKKQFNTNQNYGAFVSSGGKVYFNLVNSGTTILDAGDTFSFRGAYKFYSKQLVS